MASLKEMDKGNSVKLILTVNGQVKEPTFSSLPALGPKCCHFWAIELPLASPPFHSLCYSKAEPPHMDPLMHICAEPKPSVMLQAYSPTTALPKYLVCCRRRAAESGSLPVPLSPGSVVLTQLFYLVLKPLDLASPSAWLCFSVFILLVLEVKALPGNLSLARNLFGHPLWMEASILGVSFYSHCHCFCRSCSEVSPAVRPPAPSSSRRRPSHQCSQQMICPLARIWRILLWYVYPGAFLLLFHPLLNIFSLTRSCSVDV